MRAPPWNALIGGFLVCLLLVCAIISMVWTPYDPLALNFGRRLMPPSSANWLGTDEYGRDVLSRLMAGASVSFSISFLTVAMAGSIGTLVGLVAGYARGAVDQVIMTFVNALLSFPGMVLALSLVAVFGSGRFGTITALSLAFAPAVARIVRGSVFSIREKEFIDASFIMGNSGFYTVWRHVLPNCVAPLSVLLTSMLCWALLAESGLSFLGLGVAPPTPTWGNMLAGSRAYIGSAEWLGILPGLCVTLSILGFNLIGDALRDRLDPQMRGIG